MCVLYFYVFVLLCKVPWETVLKALCQNKVIIIIIWYGSSSKVSSTWSLNSHSLLLSALTEIHSLKVPFMRDCMSDLKCEYSEQLLWFLSFHIQLNTSCTETKNSCLRVSEKRRVKWWSGEVMKDEGEGLVCGAVNCNL